MDPTPDTIRALVRLRDRILAQSLPTEDVIERATEYDLELMLREALEDLRDLRMMAAQTLPADTRDYGRGGAR